MQVQVTTLLSKSMFKGIRLLSRADAFSLFIESVIIRHKKTFVFMLTIQEGVVMI
ncbi:hypothetical protein PaecuDRAFT_0641 [Paenibacillus curdlanolyticus YK9]|uniref:Uncharacterized protein n=1 Tax=Paenibacillus curdlanolyticus YK9 TaxID=717606 RepID=E0I4B6_9BACL|nr:hypothetical protein PaecuDRAFT_0641 [Paenibacillus curdlanolyticus YK9]